jgi:acyl-CoA synthetase (AMP-forming)/AMP-acid ligase II
MTPEPLSALLDRSDAPALIVGEDGQKLSHAELADRIEALAGRLAAAGVHRGDRVALVMPNGPEYIQLFLAITMVGAAAAPLNPAYTHGEFVFYLTDIAPKLMLVPASRGDQRCRGAVADRPDRAARQ